MRESDLPVLFAHQVDPQATRMAAFPSRTEAAFMLHWKTRVLGNPEGCVRAIVCEAVVAGYLTNWHDGGQAPGRRWAGARILGQGHRHVRAVRISGRRPPPALVCGGTHNACAIRVLAKCGFDTTGEVTPVHGEGIFETVMRPDAKTRLNSLA